MISTVLERAKMCGDVIGSQRARELLVIGSERQIQAYVASERCAFENIQLIRDRSWTEPDLKSA